MKNGSSAGPGAKARAPIASLIHKSEQARQKLTPGTWQHTMLTENLKALHMGAALLDREEGGAVPFPPEELEAARRAFTSMIARTQAAQPKFPPGTAQHTLLQNRLFALQAADALVGLAQEGASPMWTCPHCGRAFAHTEQHHFCTQPPQTIAEYIAGQSEEIQPRLREVYGVIKAQLPDATEKISWQMPTFWKGQNLIHFAAAKQHIGLYPGGRATEVFAAQLTGFQTSKGSIRLPHHQPLPLELIAEIARWCGKENAK